MSVHFLSLLCFIYWGLSVPTYVTALHSTLVCLSLALDNIADSLLKKNLITMQLSDTGSNLGSVGHDTPKPYKQVFWGLCWHSADRGWTPPLRPQATKGQIITVCCFEFCYCLRLQAHLSVSDDLVDIRPAGIVVSV